MAPLIGNRKETRVEKKKWRGSFLSPEQRGVKKVAQEGRLVLVQAFLLLKESRRSSW